MAQGDIPMIITDRFQWGVVKEKFTELLELVGIQSRPYMDECLASGKAEVKEGFSKVEATLSSELAAGRTEIRKGFTRLGWILGLGILFTLLAGGWMIFRHPSVTPPPATKTTTLGSPNTQATGNQGATSAPSTQAKAPEIGDKVVRKVNHAGVEQGYDVWNMTDETLDMLLPNGGKVGTLGPRAYQSLPCRGGHVWMFFRGESVEEVLDHSFKPGETWFTLEIRKPSEGG